MRVKQFLLVVFLVTPLLGYLPPVADGLNALAARWVMKGNTAAADLVFRALALYGNGDALNNRAVLFYCGYGVAKNKTRAQALFTKAAARGNVAARYNLAYILPSRFKTPAPTIKKTLAYLRPNVVQGDAYSAALLARKLYYVNRDAFSPDRRKEKRTALALAAATQDPDFVMLYAKQLASQARELEDDQLLREAVSAFERADANQDVRAAYELGHLRWHLQPWLRPKDRPAFLMQHDRFGWWRRAVEAGNPYAGCLLGIHLFRRAEQIFDPRRINLNVEQRADLRIARARTDMREAAPLLKSCADFNKPRGKRRLVIVGPTLRLGKPRPGVPALLTSRGWANYNLGVAHVNGWGVTRDLKLAKTYLHRAADKHKFKNAKELLASFEQHASLHVD